MSLKDKNVVVTGANRGIGQALVEEALRRGAKRVYAGMRNPEPHPDKRVTPLKLDVTSAEQIQRAAGQVDILDMLITWLPFRSHQPTQSPRQLRSTVVGGDRGRHRQGR